MLRERAGVTISSKKSRKVPFLVNCSSMSPLMLQLPPKPMPERHKVDPFNDDLVHPFTEMNLYLNYEELMEVIEHSSNDSSSGDW